MIVIGVDVHKQSVTAVAVDGAGRMLDERTVAVGSEELLGWASTLDEERLWGLQDCRLVTPWRLRWHLFELDPTLVVPLRMLGRASHLERVSCWLARRDQELQVRLARELVTSCRSLNRAIAELEQELEARTKATAPALLDLPGCAAVTA